MKNKTQKQFGITALVIGIVALLIIARQHEAIPNYPKDVFIIALAFFLIIFFYTIRLKKYNSDVIDKIISDMEGDYGFIDKTGKVVIPCIWKCALEFHEGLASVEDDNEKWGFIDKTGKIVIPCKWQNAGDFSEDLAPVKDDNEKWGFIDKTGEFVLPCKWKDVGRFSDGLTSVKDDNEKWGFIDKTGQVVIPCHWKGAGYFSEGLAQVWKESI